MAQAWGALFADPAALAAATAALVCAVAYGKLWNARPPSPSRTALKTGAMALLAAAAWLAGGPIYLTVALGFSALGDLLLAGDGRPRFILGVVAFAVAHGAYIPLFLEMGAGQAPMGLPRMLIVANLVLVVGFVLIKWLWPRLGVMRAPLSAYFAIIVVMTALAWSLPESGAAWVVGLGATAFLLSDAILGVEMFALKPDARARGWTRHAVWILYAGGQGLIALGIMAIAAGG
jgi:uncharacterized membrane protein YhhN